MRIIAAVTAVILLCMPLAAQNPFLKRGETNVQPEKHEQKGISAHYPPFMRTLLHRVNNVQRSMNERISSLFHDIKETHSAAAVSLILLFSFLYGALHALGPGHGKIIVSSYFLARRSHWKDGILTGTITALLHALSAIAVVLILHFIVRSSLLIGIDSAGRIVNKASAFLIAAIGVYLIISMLLPHVQKQKADGEKTTGMGGILSIALSIGIVPCPGAALILIFSITLSLLPIGIAAVLAMSLGMAVTISAFSVAAIQSQNGVSKLPIKDGTLAAILFLLRMLGSIAVLVLGIILILAY